MPLVRIILVDGLPRPPIGDGSDPATTVAPLATRNFVAANAPVPPPARPQQPCLGAGDRGAIGGRSRTPGPSLEPPARGSGVDPRLGIRGSWRSLPRMLTRVQQDVRKRRSYLPGRAERAVVITAVEYRSPPIEDPIHRASQARGQALHPIRQRCDALRFDEQVDVIVLERVVNDAEVCALRDRAERALHLANQAHRSQRWHVLANTNRHQTRMAFRKLRTPAMPYPRSRRSFSSGTLPRSTPMHRQFQIQLELGSTRHTLDCGYVLWKCQDRFQLFFDRCLSQVYETADRCERSGINRTIDPGTRAAPHSYPQNLLQRSWSGSARCVSLPCA